MESILPTITKWTKPLNNSMFIDYYNMPLLQYKKSLNRQWIFWVRPTIEFEYNITHDNYGLERYFGSLLATLATIRWVDHDAPMEFTIHYMGPTILTNDTNASFGMTLRPFWANSFLWPEEAVSFLIREYYNTVRDVAPYPHLITITKTFVQYRHKLITSDGLYY